MSPLHPKSIGGGSTGCWFCLYEVLLFVVYKLLLIFFLVLICLCYLLLLGLFWRECLLVLITFCLVGFLGGVFFERGYCLVCLLVFWETG